MNIIPRLSPQSSVLSTVASLIFVVGLASAAPKLAPAKLAGEAVEDLSAPYNVQAVTLNRNVNMNWEWNPPDPGPSFTHFGFEVMRGTAIIAIVPKTAYNDLQVPIGDHTYQIRAKGMAKEMGKKIAHYSGWSEPVGAAIKLTCTGVPVINLEVTPTKKVYGAIPALRMRFVGNVQVPEGCGVEKVLFHIDSGVGSKRTGPLTVNAQGHFDEFVDAMGAEDEPITSNARFEVTVTAQSEAGGGTSGVYVIDLERENRFAPKNR